MHNVFVRKEAEELQVQLSNGRMMSLEEIINDYERLLEKEFSKRKPTMSKLKVGEWFRIDREVIDQQKEEIHSQCEGAGDAGKKLWERFEKSNEVADADPEQYPRLIETYIFELDWKSKTEQEMRDMCDLQGDGMCDEVICDLELQMRICNGEPMEYLLTKEDRLPCVRVIQFRDGNTGFIGGGSEYGYKYPPTDITEEYFCPDNEMSEYTPYAFRRVLS